MKVAFVVLSVACVALATDINVKYTFPLTDALAKEVGSADTFYEDFHREMQSQASLVAQLASIADGAHGASFVEGPQGTSGDLSATVSEIIDAANHIMPSASIAASQDVPAGVRDVADAASAKATQAASAMSPRASFLESDGDLHAFVTAALDKVKAVSDKIQKEQAALEATMSQKSGGFAGVEVAANACNYMRLASEQAYSNVNTVVNTVGRVVAKMCGCIMVSKVAVCPLDQVAEVCQYPYQAYANLYSTSAQLWEAVKATTAQCKVIGHPSVASSR